MWYMWGVFSVKRYTFEDLQRRGNIHRFDRCAVKDSTVGVCSACMKGRVSSTLKFSGKNWVNTALCQDMPAVLADLTIVERNVVARSHLIGYIIRLSMTLKVGFSCRGARGHIVAFKQDPILLLKILPSPEITILLFPGTEELRLVCKKISVFFLLARANPPWRGKRV
jgi:hypothetical protein